MFANRSCVLWSNLPLTQTYTDFLVLCPSNTHTNFPVLCPSHKRPCTLPLTQTHTGFPALCPSKKHTQVSLYGALTQTSVYSAPHRLPCTVPLTQTSLYCANHVLLAAISHKLMYHNDHAQMMYYNENKSKPVQNDSFHSPLCPSWWGWPPAWPSPWKLSEHSVSLEDHGPAAWPPLVDSPAAPPRPWGIVWGDMSVCWKS